MDEGIKVFVRTKERSVKGQGENGAENTIGSFTLPAGTEEVTLNIGGAETRLVLKWHEPLPINLTRRELETALLLLRGLKPKQIAAEFVISINTVKEHISNVLKKCGCKSMVELIFKYRM